MEQEPTVEVDRERYDELLRIEELYDELSHVIVGDKMQPPLVPAVSMKRDAQRYRWLREPNNGTDYFAANCPIREAFDAWVDEQMGSTPR